MISLDKQFSLQGEVVVGVMDVLRIVVIVPCSLLVNVVTRPRGELRVELLDGAGKVIPGYSRNDCRPIQGDHHSTPVSWTSGTVAPNSAAKARFLLKRAFLYGFESEER